MSANPALITVGDASAVAVVAPAACAVVTVQQQQGSDPPSYKFQPYQADGTTTIGPVLPPGTNFSFTAPPGAVFQAGQTVGFVKLIGMPSGATAPFSVFADPYLSTSPANSAQTQRATIVLTSAQLKALQTTAVRILNGVPGYLIVITRMLANYIFGATAYTIANADNAIQLEYAGQSTDLAKVLATGLVDQTVNTFDMAPALLTGPLASSVGVGLGVEAKLIGTTPALTLGDGTVAVTVDYTLVPAS